MTKIVFFFKQINAFCNLSIVVCFFGDKKTFFQYWINFKADNFLQKKSLAGNLKIICSLTYKSFKCNKILEYH